MSSLSSASFPAHRHAAVANYRASAKRGRQGRGEREGEEEVDGKEQKQDSGICSYLKEMAEHVTTISQMLRAKELMSHHRKVTRGEK